MKGAWNNMDAGYRKPTVILASYPRSGNTFLRNILLDVYGIFSWNNLEKYHQAMDKVAGFEDISRHKPLPEKRQKRLDELKQQLLFPVIKTHELPAMIMDKCSEDARVIYLIRDGRDALVSMAHHRKDITEPGTDFLNNLREAILAAHGSYFGGWSKNVTEWAAIADAVIFFEELVASPVETIEKLRGIIDLPLADRSKVPTFDSQRNGGSFFGGSARMNKSDKEKETFNKLFFRSGKIGGWKEEMPEDLEELFWEKHGNTSEAFGYLKDGTLDHAKWHR